MSVFFFPRCLPTNNDVAKVPVLGGVDLAESGSGVNLPRSIKGHGWRRRRMALSRSRNGARSCLLVRSVSWLIRCESTKGVLANQFGPTCAFVDPALALQIGRNPINVC